MDSVELSGDALYSLSVLLSIYPKSCRADWKPWLAYEGESWLVGGWGDSWMGG